MILIDYNAISIAAAIAARKFIDENEDSLRHCILNSIRAHNVSFRKKYGQVVICCDSHSWRRQVFPEYKAARRKEKSEADQQYWNMLFKVIDDTREDLEKYFPFKVIKVDGAEADDIIGTLCFQTEEFGHFEDVMIVSGDKDFLQLQTLPNVRQYSPIKKKELKESNPRTFLLEHVIKGDVSDGVPNILSPDNTFTDGLRQTPARRKLIDQLLEESNPLEGDTLSEEAKRNYYRNKRMIDLRHTPEDIQSEIIKQFEEQDKQSNSGVLSYLINKRHNMLIDCVEEFFYYE